MSTTLTATQSRQARRATVPISRAEMLDVINSFKGSTFFSCLYQSVHKQKASSPYKNVVKLQRIAGAFNWDYGKRRETVTGETDYVVKPHAWAVKDEEGKTVRWGNFITTKAGELRLQIHVRIADKSPLYLAEVGGIRRAVTRDELRPYDYAKSSTPNYTDIRSLAIESMHSIRLGGKDYTIIGNTVPTVQSGRLVSG